MAISDGATGSAVPQAAAVAQTIAKTTASRQNFIVHEKCSNRHKAEKWAKKRGATEVSQDSGFSRVAHLRRRVHRFD